MSKASCCAIHKASRNIPTAFRAVEGASAPMKRRKAREKCAKGIGARFCQPWEARGAGSRLPHVQACMDCRMPMQRLA